MSTKTVCVSVNISTENNGVVNIQPIEGITKLRVSSIIFKNGAPKRKKSKKRKNDADSDSDDCRYENGNSDLMDAIYVDLLVNEFIRGSTYYYDGKLLDDGYYTVRVPLDLDDDGTGDYFKDSGWDWESDKPVDISKLDIQIKTDKLSNPKVYDLLLELEFITLV
jgi:hypothetical protein